jgi:hypothetical protein
MDQVHENGYVAPEVFDLSWNGELGCVCGCSGGAGAGAGSGPQTVNP